jgi:hypothetical protein
MSLFKGVTENRFRELKAEQRVYQHSADTLRVSALAGLARGTWSAPTWRHLLGMVTKTSSEFIKSDIY